MVKHVDQNITETLEQNYMPYAMSVIISRAIPEIDGFKPSHRKLLYTMYKMGLITGVRTKSANVVGQTMKLNPHGDGAIYETLVRLSRGNESLLYPYVDSKGNFGKVYSRDMAYAASRYTECKLESICSEIFRDIDRDTVDFVDNYDSTMKEPALLPVAFPTILVNANQGIAVGMASNICSFNLAEVCETAIALMKNPEADIMETLKAPDFPTGGQLILSHEAMREIYRTGRGSFKLRAVYRYDKKENCIEVTEIPYTTTVEAIMDKIVDLVKQNKVRELSDIRDETDLEGLRLTLDLKRGVDPDRLMQKLFKLTPLEDSFACNFNVLIGGMPRVCGVRELLEEWTGFRTECIKRQSYFDIQKKKERLHLLKGLKKILLDIDKAIAIIRETEEESEVIPNLMIGFGIDEAQAEFIAEIKLRSLNREVVLKRIAEIETLEKEIAELEEVLRDRKKQYRIIERQLTEIAKKYSRPRRTEIIFEDEVASFVEEEQVEDYPVTVFRTREGYFKKITPQSLRMSSEHKLKEGDAVVETVECTNRAELLLFTDRQQCYKTKISEFEDTKASVLGEYLPTKLGMDPEERVVGMAVTSDYSGQMLFFFEDGKCAKVELSAYATKQNRRKLTGAYGAKSPLVALYHQTADREYELTSTAGRVLLVHAGAISVKSTRSTIGVSVMTFRGKNKLYSVRPYAEGGFAKPDRYRTKTLPAAGSFLTDGDKALREQDEQTTLES